MTQELDRKGLEILFDLFFLSFLFDLARVPGKVGPSQGLSGEPDGWRSFTTGVVLLSCLDGPCSFRVKWVSWFVVGVRRPWSWRKGADFWLRNESQDEKKSKMWTLVFSGNL